jgi:hypothetical protein
LLIACNGPQLYQSLALERAASPSHCNT